MPPISMIGMMTNAITRVMRITGLVLVLVAPRGTLGNLCDDAVSSMAAAGVSAAACSHGAISGAGAGFVAGAAGGLGLAGGFVAMGVGGGDGCLPTPDGLLPPIGLT